MCQLHTEGTKHGCGHYVITRKVSKVDCNSPYCTLSTAHNPNCRDCRHERYYGPDLTETITRRTLDYCKDCHSYYILGIGRQ